MAYASLDVHCQAFSSSCCLFRGLLSQIVCVRLLLLTSCSLRSSALHVTAMISGGLLISRKKPLLLMGSVVRTGACCLS